jgi:hypothetical protein
MAVRKKSKRSARGGTKRVRKAAKRPVRKRSAKKRATRSARKRTARKAAAPVTPPVSGPDSLGQAKIIDLSAAPRCRSRIPVEVEVAGVVERCAIVDMSSSGARLVGTKLDLPPGTPLRIRYPSTSVTMDAEFVRVTEDGFAAKILRR